ncbi:hypothetical protein Tco_1067446 [Tanacetum coccineum]|uniref:Uncharacterized protein n=1 Tax=Tanacetum coccineum TaxID=301880 RepID=A0ABQ5HDT0_9ASTR
MELNGNMGIMLTKDKLASEQSQQGASNDVLNIRVILHSIHSDDENPSSANIKQALWPVLMEPECESGQDEAFQGRLFNSFEDKGKCEHVGLKVTSPQEGKRLQDYEEMMYD